MKADLSVIGPAASIPRFITSGGTAIEAGEPLHSVAALTSGVADVNTYVLAAADTPVIGTHKFGGIAIKNSENAAAGTTLTQYLTTSNPVPYLGRIRGKAEVVASMDTASELNGLVQDVVLIDYAAIGAVDGGPLYTIKVAGSADTSGLEIVGGNSAVGTLDVVVDARAYRHDVS
jgi:hypothetical protein